MTVLAHKQAFKIHIPPPLVLLVKVMKKYILIGFESSKLHGIKKWQSTRSEI